MTRGGKEVDLVVNEVGGLGAGGVDGDDAGGELDGVPGALDEVSLRIRQAHPASHRFKGSPAWDLAAFSRTLRRRTCQGQGQGQGGGVGEGREGVYVGVRVCTAQSAVCTVWVYVSGLSPSFCTRGSRLPGIGIGKMRLQPFQSFRPNAL